MGIRDALRSIRGIPKDVAEDAADVETPEPTWFQPRDDGSYDTEATGTGGPARRLRFVPGGRVFESDVADAAPGPEQPTPCRGEYTGAGRFSVQRRFERIVSYTVLEMEAGGVTGRPGFLARRIDSADRTTAELQFFFVPDGA